MSSQPSVALVVLDTVRKDAFDRHFDWLPGKRFDWAFSTSHSTSPVHASLFTGLYPSEAGVYKAMDELGSPPGSVLAEQLTREGYRTEAFTANPLISPPFNFDRGFDSFRPSWNIRHAVEDLFDWNTFVSENTGPSRYLKAILSAVRSENPTLSSLKQAVRLKLGDLGVSKYEDSGARECNQWLRDRDFDRGPSFLFVNLMEAHSPYRPPSSYQTVNDEQYEYPDAIEVAFGNIDVDAERLKQAYDDSVRYLSDQYARIFDRLKDAFDIIITCADHGELFGEENFDGLWGHDHGVYEPLTHVPLVVYDDDIQSERVSSPVSLRDVYDTVLSIAAVGDPDADLREERGRGDVLTQTHGIPENHLKSLEERHDEEALCRAKEYDRSYAGLALEDYYGYESAGGWVDMGTPPDGEDPRERLNQIRDGLDEGPASSHRKVSGKLKHQLESLGYR